MGCVVTMETNLIRIQAQRASYTAQLSHQIEQFHEFHHQLTFVHTPRDKMIQQFEVPCHDMQLKSEFPNSLTHPYLYLIYRYKYLNK